LQHTHKIDERKPKTKTKQNKKLPCWLPSTQTHTHDEKKENLLLVASTPS
jgi:hypothetical protein